MNKNTHHENKPMKVLIWEWMVVLPLIPWGIFMTWTWMYILLGWIVLLTGLSVINWRVSDLILRLWVMSKGKTCHARKKNHR